MSGATKTLPTTWDEFVRWYDDRPTYDATPERVAIDREIIRIASGGPDNWHLHAARAAELVAQYGA